MLCSLHAFFVTLTSTHVSILSVCISLRLRWSLHPEWPCPYVVFSTHLSFCGTIMNNQHLSAMIKSSHDISWFIPDFWIQSSPLIVPSQALAMSTGLKKISISEHPDILWLKSLRNEQACLSCRMSLFTKFLEKTLGFHSRFTNSIVLLQIKESSNARSFTKT